MHTIELTDEELRLAVNAVNSFLEGIEEDEEYFDHEERELLGKIKQLKHLLGKLESA